MYLRERVLKVLKVKNVLLIIAGVFFMFFGAYLIIDLLTYYRDDIDTALHAKSMPGAIRAVIFSVCSFLVATVSRKLMGDARFYSSYFEGSLEGRITFKELSKVTGKPVFWVIIELSLFKFIYMKKYSFVTVEGNKIIELYSKKALCECKNCGAPIDKRIYFTGTCSYCGSSDLFAKVLSGDRFYSITNEVQKGHNKPAYYQKDNLDVKKNLFIAFCIVGLGVAALCLFMVGDSIAKYNDHDYLVKQIMDPSKHLSSFSMVRADLLHLIVWGSILGLIFIILAVRRFFKVFFVNEAESCAVCFSKSEKPFIPASDIPSIKAKGEKKMHRVRGALRNGYLAHCTLEMHDEELKVALAKKIVKDTCPSCATPITGAVDENYTCQTCGNKIMGVIEKK